MMPQPIVSVIIPAYRCANTIDEAIQSALDQNVDVEIIVIDDCPDQPITDVMIKYRNNPQIMYLQNEQNIGAAESRNRGVAQAHAPFIAFLDADDRWLPGKLDKQLQLMKQSGGVLCCTARELISPDGAATGRVIPVKERVSYRELLKHNSINCSSVMMTQEIAREFPMTNEDSHEDYILWLRILQKYDCALGINEPLLQYRLSNTGKSGSKLKSAKMTFMVYRHLGFGPVKSVCCFCSYALHGVWKYLFTKRKGA